MLNNNLLYIYTLLLDINVILEVRLHQVDETSSSYTSSIYGGRRLTKTNITVYSWIVHIVLSIDSTLFTIH